MRRTVAAVLSLAALLAFAPLAPTAPRAAASESVLLMLESPGCPYCALWRREVGPEYPKTAEGRAAPLRVVNIAEDWPEDLAHVRRERLTPTFILLRDGAEIGRIVGFPGEDFFWPMLNDLLERPAP